MGILIGDDPQFQNEKIIQSGLLLNVDAAVKDSYNTRYGGGGTAWNDLTSVGNSFGVSGDASFIKDYGGGFHCDQNSFLRETYVNKTDFATDASNGRMTLGMWLRPNKWVDNQAIWVFGSDIDNNFPWCMMKARNTTNSWQFYVGTAGYVISTTMTIGLPHYLVLTYDDSQYELHLNGVSQGTDAYPLGLSNGDQFFVNAGAESAVNRSEDMDYFMIHMYDRDLSETEINYNFDVTRKRFGV